MCDKKRNTNLNHKARSIKIVKNLQNRILRAEQSGNNKKVKNLQKLLLHSKSNYIVADQVDQNITKLKSKTIRKMIDNVWCSLKNKVSTSPHSCIHNIKKLCKQKNNAIVFHLKIESKVFNKYITKTLTHFSCKKQLQEFLLCQKKNYSLLLHTFSQNINNDFHQFAMDNKIDMAYHHGKIIVITNKEKDMCQKLYPFLEKNGFFVYAKKKSLLQEGVDFLGFTICNQNEEIISTPSDYEVKRHMQHLSRLWKWARGKEITLVIQKINYVIKKWHQYFCYQQYSKTFKKIQMYQLKKQQKWATSSHPKKSKKWAFAKYFNNCSHKKKWTFGLDDSFMLHHSM